jgi:hypothetical protein
MSSRREQQWRALLQAVDAAARLGRQEPSPGTVLVGHIPHVAPLAYLHVLYRPLDRGELEELARSFSQPLPEEYLWLLGQTNGLNLFADSLAIFGVERSRSRDPSRHQPYDVVRMNEFERLPALDPHIFLVGAHGDGMAIYLDSRSGAATSRGPFEDPTIREEWPSLLDLLSDEFSRLSDSFDEQGREKTD